MIQKVIAGVLEIAYLEIGPSNGAPVVLLHGFPFELHSYDGVARTLASEGKRCLIPYLRGYGPTRFLSSRT
ncbi:alpha/beta fold hydrolase, partial [Pseudomonas viridiflava]|uniref:alpha/beta fold hydrolase n=1 Tax=Pseudomonas viridiflava TaxID=33069 RepID=UPI003C75050C